MDLICELATPAMFLPKKAGAYRSVDHAGHTIQYHYNAFGYRSLDFHQTGSHFLALGGCHTEGIGLDIKDVWPSVLSRDLNLSAANLGIQYCDPFHIAQNVSNWITGVPRHKRWKLPKPEFVIIQWPLFKSQGDIRNWVPALVMANRVCRSQNISVYNFTLDTVETNRDSDAIIANEKIILYSGKDWPTDKAAWDNKHHSAECHGIWASNLKSLLAR